MDQIVQVFSKELKNQMQINRRKNMINCLIKIKKGVLSLKNVPESMRTDEICFAAVSKNGLELQYVPMDLRTLELCKVALLNNRLAKVYVPENISKELEKYNHFKTKLPKIKSKSRKEELER